MRVGRIVMGAFYLGAGMTHWFFTKTFAAIVPDYLPAHRELVYLSGAAEMAGGLGVLLPAVRRPAAWGITLLLLAIFPANLWMAQHPERFRPIPGWVLWARLPFQLPLIWWALQYTRKEDS